MAEPKLPGNPNNSDFAKLKACAANAVIEHGPQNGNLLTGPGFFDGTVRFESVDPRIVANMREGRPVKEGEVLKCVDVTVSPPLPNGGGVAGLPVDIDIHIMKPGYSAHLGGIDRTRTSLSMHEPGDGLEFKSDPGLGVMQKEANNIRTAIDGCMASPAAQPVKKPFLPFKP